MKNDIYGYIGVYGDNLGETVVDDSVVEKILLTWRNSQIYAEKYR
jgi:hypothetical protein